jgi:rod shape determining protein RodA
MLTSLFFIFSAEAGAAHGKWKAQGLWIILGGLVYLITSLVHYKTYLRYGHILYLISLVFLLLLWTPLGQRAFGALRWLNMHFFLIQPSELAKVGTLLYLAGLLTRSKMGTLRQSLGILAQVGGLVSLPFVLIFLQPDLGSAFVFPIMVFALLYVSRLPKQFFVGALGVFLLVVGAVSWDVSRYYQFLKTHELSAHRDLGTYEKHSLLPLKDYQRNRILSFVSPESIDPQGIGVGWNLKQSLISVGSGGFWGKGHNQGTQAKLGYLPQAVARNDFIFSVFAEEMGFLGSVCMLCAYGSLILNNLRVAALSADRFGLFVCVGVATVLVVHVFVNIGMTLGIMPITGVPLPFFSYGGSSLLIFCALQGIVQSVYRYH